MVSDNSFFSYRHVIQSTRYFWNCLLKRGHVNWIKTFLKAPSITKQNIQSRGPLPAYWLYMVLCKGLLCLLPRLCLTLFILNLKTYYILFFYFKVRAWSSSIKIFGTETLWGCKAECKAGVFISELDWLLTPYFTVNIFTSMDMH